MFLLCISVAPYLPRLSDSNSQMNGFLSFLSVGARAQVSFFFAKFRRH